jgi:hypothetical protein
MKMSATIVNQSAKVDQNLRDLFVIVKAHLLWGVTIVRVAVCSIFGG